MSSSASAATSEPPSATGRIEMLRGLLQQAEAEWRAATARLRRALDQPDACEIERSARAVSEASGRLAGFAHLICTEHE